MNFKNVIAAIMTADIETAKKWYTEMLGKEPDRNPMESLYEWDFPEGGVLQLFEDKDRAGYSSITIFVEDIESLKDQFTKKDIASGKTTEGDFVKTMIVHDPENNRIAFAQSSQGR